ncbi:hypothetical protein L9F63_019077, partial [Diploptera punctata]
QSKRFIYICVTPLSYFLRILCLYIDGTQRPHVPGWTLLRTGDTDHQVCVLCGSSIH